MSTHDHMTAVWRQAAQDLGFEFITPFTLPDGGQTLTYLGLVPQFGRRKGMLVIVGLHATHHARVAQQHGYGWSCLPASSDAYDRKGFVDMLNDWGWFGAPHTAPAWYTGEPWMS